MAILRGFFDGTIVPDQPVLDSAAVDTFLVVSNNGPNVLTVRTLGSFFPIQNASSQAFFLPSGTSVRIDGPASTASWELAVPG